MMATDDPLPDGGGSSVSNPDLLRRAFRLLNRFMVPLWRMGLGGVLNSWPSVGGRLMVLVHRGRRSGKEYRTPLSYATVDGRVYCLAGFGGSTDWYRNALASRSVEVWLPDGRWEARAMDASESPDRTELMRAVLIGSGFAAYVAGFKPRHMSGDELERKTRDYRLLCLERQAVRTGPGGPGDLVWVWPGVAAALAMVLRGARRRKATCAGSTLV